MSDARGEFPDLSRTVGDAEVVRGVLDGLPAMVIAVEGPQMRISAINAAMRARLARTDVIGAPLHEVVTDTAPPQAIALCEQVYETGKPVSVKQRSLHLDPESGKRLELITECTVAPRLAADGTVSGAIATVFDVGAVLAQRQEVQQRGSEEPGRQEHAHDVTDALQRQMLPTGLPVLPRARISAGYLPADIGTKAGGDWFDALSLPDGRVALVVGDVVGHGIAASAAMGMLRTVLHEQFATGATVGAAVAAADASAGRIPGARAATACVAALDPTTRLLRYRTAGHPPPLLITAAGEARYLPATGAGPLGVGAESTDEVVAEEQLPEGAMVLLHTDGVLARDIAAGLALPGGDPLPPTERLCTQTLELLAGTRRRSDDIALLVAQLIDPTPPLTISATTGECSLAEVRQRLREWLAGISLNDRDVSALLHVVTELATNTMEHAYIDSPGAHPYEVTAALSDTGDVRLSVTDHGAWREPHPSPDRGLGLQLTAGLVDSMHIDHDDTGTRVTARYRPSRPAHLLTAGRSHRDEPPAPAPTGHLLALDQPWTARPRIHLDGPIDADTVNSVNKAVRSAGATGTRSLTIDLTEVSDLASAGVAALYDLRRMHNDNDSELRLYAPTDCAADMILTLAGLGHDTADPDAPIDGR